MDTQRKTRACLPLLATSLSTHIVSISRGYVVVNEETKGALSLLDVVTGVPMNKHD